MRISSLLLFLTAAIAPKILAAQALRSLPSIERPDQWRATITIFRSPGTGLMVSRGHFAAFVGHYPTVLKRIDGQRATQFIRFGAAYYVAPNAATSPYASLSLAPSLSKGWSNSGIADVGIRRMFTSKLSGQLGVALLYAPHSNETRLNPTVGLGVRF